MKLQRWKRRKESRAPEILEAALACFGDKGFAATRMDDIAARAGITKGTIYLYFDSKQAVFEALARQSAGAQIATVTAHVMASDAPSPDLLRFVIGTLGQFMRTTDRIVHAGLEFDAASGELWVHGRPVELSRRERALLAALLQQPRRILSPEQLRDRLYGMAQEVESNAVNVHVHHLRRKIGPGIVETVRGVGFRLGSAP